MRWQEEQVRKAKEKKARERKYVDGVVQVVPGEARVRASLHQSVSPASSGPAT